MADKSDTEDLNLTTEEAHRLKNAFENKDFLKLFQEYVEDVNSDKSRSVFEEEIIAMEKERGFDVKFVHPDPVYVMKFVTDGGKIFINICKNQYAQKPISQRKITGFEWKIPTILTKPREDLDKKGTKCTVIDVMFHPTTLELAGSSSRFKNMIEDTAVSMVQEQFSVNLNLKTAVRPKMRYKGKAPPVILRQNPKKGHTCEPIHDYYKKLVTSKETCSTDKECSKIRDSRKPEYSIKYRDILDLKDYSLMGYADKVAPKQIVIEIQLPDVQSATEVELDVFDKQIRLKSCPKMAHNYILDLNLSYNVDTNVCTAKFDNAKKVMEVILPVKERDVPKRQ